jgi:hypothetical protein
LRRLHLHCRCHGPPAVTTPQQVCLELHGYQVPLAHSQKAPPPEMHMVVSRGEAHAVVPLTTVALAGCEVSVSHLSLKQEECKITMFFRPPENRDKEKIIL